MTAVEETHVDASVVWVSPDQLVFDPTNRVVTDEEVDRLVPSVAELGVLEPILVADIGEDGCYGVCDGEVRTRAARKAGRDRVPVFVNASFEDRRRWVEAQTVTNLARIDVHELDQGAKFAQLRDLGHTTRSTSDLLGQKVSQPTVVKRLKVVDSLGRLDADVRGSIEAAYRAGHLSVRHAEAIADLVDVEEDDLAAGVDVDVRDRALAALAEPIGYVLDLAASDHRRGELDRELPRLVTETRKARDVRIARAQLAADRVRDVTDEPTSEWEFLHDLAPVDGHEQLSCHAAFVNSFGEVRLVCTDPDAHRAAADPATDADAPSDDGLEGDEFRTQDEIAEAERAHADRSTAAGSRPAPPEVRIVAAERVAARDRADQVRDAAPQRVEAMRGIAGRARAQGTALLVLLEQLLLDDGTDPLVDLVADVLDLDIDDDMTEDQRLAVLAAYVDDVDEGEIRMAWALAFALAEYRLTSAVAHGHAVADDRAIRVHLNRLQADGGYTLTNGEQELLTPPTFGICRGCDAAIRLDAEGHVVEHDDSDGARCEGSAHTPVTDDTSTSDGDEAEIGAVEWPAYVAAKVDLVQFTSSKPKAHAFEAAKQALAAALVARHPDVHELNSDLAALVELRTDIEHRRDNGDPAGADALQAKYSPALLDMLGKAGPIVSDLVEAIAGGMEIVAWTRPPKAKPGDSRRLYLDDIVDAAKERP